MPCLIHYSEAGQVVILAGHMVRKYFDPAKPADWAALIESIKFESRCDQSVETMNGASIEQLVENYRAVKAQEEKNVKRYTETGQRKLSLEELGL
jgi:hypothetical protein